jgi:hypothetical protein
MMDCEGEKMRPSVATNLALENRYNNMCNIYCTSNIYCSMKIMINYRVLAIY